MYNDKAVFTISASGGATRHYMVHLHHLYFFNHLHFHSFLTSFKLKLVSLGLATTRLYY